MGRLVVESWHGGLINSTALAKMVQHAQHPLLPKIDDVQTLRKFVEADMLLHCKWKGKCH